MALYGHLTIEDLTLYGDWAELTLELMPKFYSTYNDYQLSLQKMTNEDVEIISKQAAQYAETSKKIEELEEKIKLLDESERGPFLLELEEYKKKNEAIGLELVKINAEKAISGGYSEQDLKKIKETREAYIKTRDDILKLISQGLTHPDRTTPLYNFEEYAKLSPGVKERLIIDVLRHEDNGINPFFLKKTEALFQKNSAKFNSLVLS